MKTRSVAAVLVGGVVDIAATNLFAVPLVMYVVFRDRPAGPDATQTLVHTISSDPALVATSMLFGGLASVIGGYTAAWMAGRNHLLIGALSAYSCTAFGIAALVHGTPGVSLLQHFGGFLLSPALGLLGGYLRSLQSRRVVRA